MKEINELKARAYDTIAQIEYLQNMLKDINAEIGKRIQEYNEAIKKTEDGEQPELIG